MKSANGKILVAILIIVIIIAAILLGVKIAKESSILQTAVEENKENQNSKTVVEIKQPQIFKGTDRPIAVMIDNHKSAMPQANLGKAYMVYEIIVEGGETRLMALYKGQDLEKLGPIRSSRHYFLDYALENDAIYVHFGFSPQAKNDIAKLGVNNINGIYESSKNFWRVKDKYAPHNAVTSTKNVLEIAKRDNYRVTSDKESVLKYVGEELNLNSNIIANTVTIPYSDSNTVSYEYSEETKTYTRYSRKTKQVDWDTKEAITAKNIIITFCKNTRLNDGENKDRQTIDNIKALKGYYITNGKAVEIICEKTSRSGKTTYKTLEGKEIEVNDGNTFVQICPIDSNVTFTPGEQVGNN